MVMPTWLFGSCSVTTDSGVAISADSTGREYGSTAWPHQARLRQVVGLQTGGQIGGPVGVGLGGGLASTGPVPGSGGTTKGTGFGVGLLPLSPGSLATNRVSVRNQLLLAPPTTSAGLVNQRLPGTPARALSMNVCIAGEATKMPSDPPHSNPHIVWVLSRTSPTQIAAARSGVKATVTASLKFSVVPVLAATVRLFQWSALPQPKIMQRFESSAMIWAMIGDPRVK